MAMHIQGYVLSKWDTSGTSNYLQGAVKMFHHWDKKYAKGISNQSKI